MRDPSGSHPGAAGPSDPIREGSDDGRETRKKRRPGARRRLFFRIVRRSGVSFVLVLILAVAVVSQTREGQELVLQAALDRVRGALAGELIVGGIRSGTLLTGATLTNVRLDAADGRRFLRADSVVLRYSIVSILAGGPPVRTTTIHGADVEISRFTSEDALNVTRLLAESDGAGDSTTAGPVGLGRIGIRGGTVRLLTPATGDRGGSVAGPDGGALQQIRIDDLDLDLERAVVRRGAAVSFEAGLASFSGSVFVLDEPLVVREVFGSVTFGVQGLRIQDAAIRLPSTLLRGELAVGPRAPGDPWILRSRLTVDGWGELADLAWIDGRIPDGQFRGTASVSIPGAIDVFLEGFEAQLPASHVLVDGMISFGETIAMRSLEVTGRPLALARLEPWLGIDLPLDGWLSGRTTFSGTLSDIGASGRLTLVPTGYGGAPTTADFNGIVHRGENPGATGFTAQIGPLNYDVLRAFWPDAPFAGSGSGSLELDGRASRGMTLVADFSHGSAASSSRVLARGTVQRLADGAWTTDLRGDVAPLSIAAFASLAPGLGLRGTVTGPVSVAGRLDDLRVSGELEAEGGTVVLDGALDLASPGESYRLRADAAGLPLSALIAELPDSTSWSGRLELDGTGLDLATMRGGGSLIANASRVAAVPVDSVAGAFRLDRGVLITDTLVATVAGIGLRGKGRFGLVEGAWGSSRFDFEAPTVRGLRPLLMGVGDSVMVRDGLDELEIDFLRASGIEPDTLPQERDIRLDGAVRGSVSVSGELASFDMGLVVDLTGGAFRHNEVDSARVGVTATGLPSLEGSWGLGASARGVVWEGRSFEQGGFEASMIQGQGNGRIEIVRTEAEQYRLAGTFRRNDPGGEVGLETAQVQVGQDFWILTRPGTVAWGEGSLTIDSLRVDREGADPMWLEARGTLTRGGESDFLVTIRGLHVDRFVHVAQLSDIDVGGHVDLDLAVSGPAESPTINGEFRVDGPRFRAMELTRIDGSLDYADQRAVFSLQGWDGGRDAIDASGEFPVDLSLAAVENRVLDRPMELRISADSLDAAIALSYLSDLQQVVGVVSGDVAVGGTPGAPAPEGSMRLSNAEWTIEALGVRHAGVNGDLTLNPDRTVDVSLTSTGTGRSTVEGRVTLEPFLDPPLNLVFRFDRFQAVERIDVEALISGQFALGGSYRRPVASGSLTLDESTVYVDEFQRAAGVVDLSDPLLYERGLGVDTTALMSQPLLAGLRNPFLDNLRVDIQLDVPRDTWLRSIETNVEMAGDLLVAYDRSRSDLVLVGELEAVRGSHQVLNRTFEVDGGTVSFIGRPGLNPDLDIDASSRVRRREDDLEVLAHVGGTLIQPVVTLSTDDVGVGQADLVSYLIFGQPMTQLGSSQAQLMSQGSNNAVSGIAGDLGTWYGGTLASRFGAAIAQGSGLVDYISVQRGRALLSDTQVEAGRYLGQDVFVVLVFERPTGAAESPNPVRGARVEWEATNGYHLEGFFEDRFLRSGAAGLALPDLLRNNFVVGLFVFREWGY